MSLHIDAWAVLDGLHIAVRGVPRYPNDSSNDGKVLVTFVPAEQVEQFGLEEVILQAVRDVARIDLTVLENALY